MLAVMVGTVFAFVAVRILYSASGVTSFSEGHETGAGFVVKVASTGSRFGPGISLVRLLTQTPLLLALLGSALVVLAVQLRRQKRDAFSWEGSLPEALLFLGTLGLLIINPTPFPYNLLHLVPYAYLFAFVHASKLVQEAQRRPRVLPLAMAVIVFAHLVPFAVATWRHVNWSNDRQLVLMRLAEELTDPIEDPVYDGIYLVPTRPIVHYGSFLHSLTLENVMDESGTRIRDMLIERPAAVIIQSYRTSWLSDEDHDFIRQRYVPLADDFWVLGKVLSEGGGEFEIHHSGRYHIAPREESNLAEPHDGNVGSVSSGKDQKAVQAGFMATLNGLPLTNRTVELNVGFHRLETAGNWIPTVVWAGPHLGQAPRIDEGSHRRLFVNWY